LGTPETCYSPATCIGTRTATLAYYNFCRVHQTLRETPAMEAALTDRLWTVKDLVALRDASNQIAA